MSQWWVRIRGRVAGPFTERDVKARLESEDYKGHEECSSDGRTWGRLDQVPEFAADDRPRRRKPLPPVAEPAEEVTTRPVGRSRRGDDFDDYGRPSSGSRGFKWIVGSLAAVLVIGTAVAVVLLMRGGKSADGAITLTRATESERTRLFEQTVCLVLPGHEVIVERGDRLEGLMLPIQDTAGNLTLRGGTGSGFVVSPNGHIITNRHVVEAWARYGNSKARQEFIRLTDASRTDPKLWVFFGAKEKHEAKLLYSSPDYDFAVLKIDAATPRFFALCDTPEKEIPQLSGLFALGFPGKDNEQVDIKGRMDQVVRDIAGKKSNYLFPVVERALPVAGFDLSNRPATVTKRSEVMLMDAVERECQVLRHSGDIYGGNSGGPLVAKDGTVIGINTWKKTAETGISFALTLPQLREMITTHVPGAVWRPHPE